MSKCRIFTCCFIHLVLALCDLHVASAIDFELYESRIRPLLIEHCYSCHSDKKNGGGLSLETAEHWLKGGDSGPAIVPFEPEASLVIEAVRYNSLEMPPPTAGRRLNEEEVELLELWIRQGATAPTAAIERIGGMSKEDARQWWSFQPLNNSQSPLSSEWIDAQIDLVIESRNLQKSPVADKRTLLRRVTYDLTGLPPTPDELRSFINDESEDAYTKVINRLLGSPDYGVKWGRHWLDVVRYADTAGENTDRPLPHAWRYRNWVFDAWNQDMPFDDFAKMQIAGDSIKSLHEPNDQYAGIIATGYLAIARRFGHDIDKDMHLTYEDVIDNLGKSFLGLSLGCARCHDHKYDPVTQDDYYGLYGIFSSSKFSYPGCEPFGQPKDLIALIGENELNAIKRDHEEQVAKYQATRESQFSVAEDIANAFNQFANLINHHKVAEGETVSLTTNLSNDMKEIALRRGELLVLTILPNDNHGADTTKINWKIQSGEQPQQQWDSDELIDRFPNGSPRITVRDADWLLIDRTNGTQFLNKKQDNVSNVESLIAFSNAELPSALVNRSENRVSVWTDLPERGLFLHPGPLQNVALGWVCPKDGNYRISGTVTDAHPAGLDGVSFRLEHIQDTNLGKAFTNLHELHQQPALQPPPEPVVPFAYGVVDGSPHDCELHQRGDPNLKGERVSRHWLSVFDGRKLSNTNESGRRELANWITANPLFSRSIANRIWQWHFGRGLVASPNDLGSRGEKPTHPILLDRLAQHLIENQFSIKSLHRLILQTQAYQRGTITDAAIARDPSNQWLSGFARRRLSAEELRDSILLASGELQRDFDGPHPFPPEKDWNFTQHNPFNAVYATSHRSAFLMVQRQRRHPYLAIFDGADPNSSTPSRQPTMIPAQSLYFLNDPFFHQQADRFAERFSDLEQTADRINAMHQLVLSREASPSESALYQNYLESDIGSPHNRWSAIARTILSSNEHLYVD